MNTRRLLRNEPVRWLRIPVLVAWTVLPPAWAAETQTPQPAAPAAVTNAAPAAATNGPPAAVAPAASTNAPAAAAPESKEPADKDKEKAKDEDKDKAKEEDKDKAKDADKDKEKDKDEDKEKKGPAVLTPEQMFEGGATTYNNWVELSTGGFLVNGNKAQFKERRQLPDGPFGGIEDFHYQGTLAKGTTFNLDGRALFDNKDYKLGFDVTKEKTGYLKLYFNQYRTWYNGDGDFFPPSGAYFPLAGSGLGLDRGEFSIEGGLTLEKMPKITFRYSHLYRDGEKGSTVWGLTHPAGGALLRGIGPSFYDINEHSDIFALDVAHTIKSVDFGVGLRYETGKLNDALKLNQFPGEPIEQKITDRQITSYDLFNVHAFGESWLKKNMMVSAGFSYSDLDNDFSGSRIYGSDFDVGFVPAAQNGVGYTDLRGGSRLHEYVTDVNFFYQPWKHFVIAPSVRVLKEDTDADTTANETSGLAAPVPFGSLSDYRTLDVRERLDLRYNGITNWVFYARGELTQGDGNLNEDGGTVPIGGIGTPPIQRHTEDDRFFQKYSVGARWYPLSRLSLNAGGYYKFNDYHYEHLLDSTPNDATSFNRYPAYLVMQNFETYDGNVGLTWRPRLNLTFVSRYEYQWSRIHTQPDPVSGLPDVESASMTSHILGQNINWSPWSRLFLGVDFNYVLSNTKDPATGIIPGILNSLNDYWTMGFSSGLVLDDKTDLKLNYFYYQANNFVDNSAVGMPFGMTDHEHGITATLTRRITDRIRWSLKYGFYAYDNLTFGGHRDYDAHLIYTSLQYRF